MLGRKVNLWKGTLEDGGLNLNVPKIEYMACRSLGSSTIHIGFMVCDSRIPPKVKRLV